MPNVALDIGVGPVLAAMFDVAGSGDYDATQDGPKDSFERDNRTGKKKSLAIGTGL